MYPINNPIPKVLTYKNYRSFLKDLVTHQKAFDSKFSFAFYSRRIKLSDAYLKLVVQGRRNLDVDKAFSLSVVLGLTPPERAYFIGLVLENQAKSVGLKRLFRSQVNELVKNKMTYSDNENLTAIFEDSLTWEVFSLIGIDDFNPDPSWISKKLKNKGASQIAVSKVLEKLMTLGAIEKTKLGVLKAKDIVVPRRFNPVKAYTTALSRAQMHLSQGLVNTSYFDSLCLILNGEQLSEIKALLEETKRSISKIISENKAAKTHIAFINTNLFLASE